MKKVFVVILSFFVSLPAEAVNTIQFAAEIQTENLAEESIELLHCLSERSGLPWEFSGLSEGSSWLRVKEAGGRLNGAFEYLGSNRKFELELGKAEIVCQELVPETALEKELISASETKLSSLEEPEPAANSAKKWIWIGAAAIALGGFFYWRTTSQPDHKTLKMD